LTWYRPQRSVWNGDPIYIDQYSTSGSYNPSGPNAVNLVLQGEDRFGDISKYQVPIASYTTGLSVNNVEISDKAVALLSSPIQGLANGGAIWVTPTAGSPGAFDIKFRTFSFQPSAIARDTGFADTYNLGNEVTLKSGIANFSSIDYDWITPASGPILVLGYTTRAAGATTQDVYYQAFNGQGQALGPSTLVASGMRAGGAIAMTDNGTSFFVAKEVLNGGVVSIEVRSFTPATGALGAATTITTNFTSLFSMAIQPQADGSFDILVDGLVAGNQHVLGVYQADASFNVSAAAVTIALASPNGVRQNVQRMANDSLVVAYTDAGQVHLAVFDAAGALIDNTIVPGITNFDRIRSLGQNQFELVWRETVAGNENAVKGAIYDVNTSGRVVDQSTSMTPVWQLGSHFDDALTGGTANDIFKGYAGNDTINGGLGQDMAKFTGNKADYTLVRNLDGSWTVTDTRGGSPDGVDTLQSIELVDFADGQKQLISAQATELTKLGAVFLDGAGAPITGAVWGRAHRGSWNGDIVLIDSYASATGYVSGGPNPQTLVVAGQDKFGDLDKTVVVANFTSGKTVNNAEVLDKGVIFYRQTSSSAPVDGTAFWVTPTAGAPAGTFDIKLQALNFTAGRLAYDTGNPSVTLVGSPTTLVSGIANYQFTDWNSASDGTVVIGYSTRAAGASTQDFWYTTVNTATGTAAFTPKKVATVSASSYGAMSASGNLFTFISEDNSGAAAMLKFQNFDATTGTLGPVVGLVNPGNLADIYNSSDIVQSDGSRLFVVEGIQLGTGNHVLQTFAVNSLNIPTGTPVTTMLTAGQTLGRLQHQPLSNGLNVVGYTDNNQVHLALFDQFGNLISDTIVPGITNFDRLRNLGQNQVELIWRETVSGVENVVKAAIFDGNDGGRFVNASGSTSAQWLLGSHFDDALTGGTANDIFKGYAGNDTINGGLGQDMAKFTGNKADYTLVRNLDGSWTVTDTRGGSPDGVDTLQSIELVDFADGQKQLISAQATELTKLGAVFLDGAGAPITGAVWGRAHRGSWNGDIVLIDSYASATGYVSGGPNPQTLVVAGQDKFGDLDKTVVVANFTSGKTVNNAEVLDKGVIFYRQTSSSAPVDGTAFWVTPTAGAPAGTFDIKLQALNFTAGRLAYDTGNPSVTLVGSPTTLVSGIANYQFTDWNSASDGTVVIGYSTRAAGASTQDFWYTTVNTATGTAAFTPKKVATVSASSYGAMSASGNLFTFISEDNSGAAAMLKFQNFDATTGTLGPVVGLVNPGNLADIYNSSDIVQSDGSRLFVVEGIQLGTGNHVLQTFAVNSLNIPTGTPVTTMLTAGQTLGRLQHQPLSNGLNVVGYTDNNQVHLALFDQFGNLISDTIVPGITNFDRLRNLGQNQVELIWRETVSGVENVVKAAIFDGNDGGRFVNASGSTNAQWLLGSHFADTLTAGTANDIFKGYAGNDSIDGGSGVNQSKYTGNVSDYTIVQNVDGSWTVTDTRGGSPDGVDTLRNVQVLDFADRAVTLGLAANADTGATIAGVASGNVLTNDARPAGDALVVRSVNGATAGVGAAIAGTYGTLTLNANGSYSYTASGAAGATGSHLHDVFTYVMTDSTVAAVFGAPAASSTATLDITLNRSVVVNASSFTPTHRSVTVASSALFSAVDADGDTITKYQFWDSSTASTSGYWTLSGTAQGAQQSIEVTAANLANMQWTVGSTADTVSIRAFDGFEWGAWKIFDINPAPESAPVVAALNYTPTHGAVTTLASALFNATDADGDTITKYQLWDGTSDASSGRWVVNGVEKAASLTFEITAAELANTVWRAGTVGDAVSVRAFDGVAWSDWTGFPIAAPPNVAPVVAASNYTPAHGAVTTPASTLFSATDADGDTITKYQLWDGTSDASSGRWVVNGVEKAASLTFEITAADLANTVWRAGTVGDAVSVRAFDGVAWSGWTSFPIAAPPNVAPVVAASNYTPAHGAVTTLASTLFSATDADGDTITKYQLWDGTSDASSGRWVVNGVEKAASLTFEITAADLANTVWRAGTVSDAVSVRAFDGVAWSGWTSFPIAAPPNVAPVVAASNYTPAHGAVTTPASTLFSATDADGDTITKYQLWDGTSDASSGRWVVNGVEKAASLTFEITAADLANTVWRAGTVSDAVSVRAFDGVAWSGWTSFPIAAPPNAAPVVAALNYTPAHGAVTTPASTLFSATDANGDTITKYQLWDGTSDASSGRWVVNGVEKAASLTFEITAADLANTVWRAGTVSDAVSVRAFDGVAWSSWTGFPIAAPPNVAPVVNATNKVATHGQAFAATALISATDADGDAITKYQLWDGSAAESSGHWAVNGVEKAASQTFEITAAELANTTFHSGSGSDQLSVRAFDGLIWGDWKAFTVTAPVDSAPVVSAPGVNLAFNQSVAASSLFLVTDAEGDTITKYQLWDGTPAASSGHWSVNGVVQQAQQTFEVLAADLASASFTAGSAAATDQLSMRAFDGYLWSDWTAFSATSHA
jgi:hypothetical protein